MLLRGLHHREYSGSAPGSRRRVLPLTLSKGNAHRFGKMSTCDERRELGSSFLSPYGPFARSVVEEHIAQRMCAMGMRARSEFVVSDDYLPTAVQFQRKAGGRSHHRDGALAAISDESGSISLIRFDKEDYEQPKDEGYFLVHPNAIFDLCWFDSDSKIISGGGDRSIRIFDVNSGKLLTSLQHHVGSVRSVKAFNQNPHMFASCGRADQVMVWDTRFKKPVLQLEGLHKPSNRNTSGSATCIMPTQDDALLATAGASDGLVKFWDLRTCGDCTNINDLESERNRKSRAAMRGPVQVLEAPERARRWRESPGISSICFDPAGSKLAVNYMRGDIVVFDWLGYRPEDVRERTRCFRGNFGWDADKSSYSCKSFYVRSCFSPDGNFLLSGSSCRGNAFVWDVYGDECEPYFALTGHKLEVSCVDWDPVEGNTIITASDDKKVRFWHTTSKDVVRQRDVTHTQIENGIPGRQRATVATSATVICNEWVNPAQARQYFGGRTRMSYNGLKLTPVTMNRINRIREPTDATTLPPNLGKVDKKVGLHIWSPPPPSLSSSPSQDDSNNFYLFKQLSKSEEWGSDEPMPIEQRNKRRPLKATTMLDFFRPKQQQIASQSQHPTQGQQKEQNQHLGNRMQNAQSSSSKRPLPAAGSVVATGASGSKPLLKKTKTLPCERDPNQFSCT